MAAFSLVLGHGILLLILKSVLQRSLILFIELRAAEDRAPRE
jgi:hypothetical protein